MLTRKKFKTDVLVVGAGASGIPAAIGAARAGANVLLIEEDPVVGGATTDFYVDMFCGGPRTGIVKEAEDILKADYSLTKRANFFLPSSFQKVFTFLLSKEKRLKVVTGARATGVILKKGSNRPRVSGVRISCRGINDVTIESKITIDATGTGQVAILAGCRAMYGRDSKKDFHEEHASSKRDNHVQQCTWMYISQQLSDKKPFNMMKLDNVKKGVLVNGFGWFHSNSDKAIRVKPRIYLHWGCAVRCRDTRDPIELAGAQREALKVMERDHALLRENGYAIYLAPRIGVREQSRILGEHVITENDLRSGILPDDTIAIGTYGLDIWGGKNLWTGLSAKERHVPGYGIPYRALLPKDVDGLLLAGKAISGTHIAMSAYRVMPIVGSIGQAAGVAAALCIKQKRQPRKIDTEEIRKTLRGRKQNLKLELD